MGSLVDIKEVMKIEQEARRLGIKEERARVRQALRSIALNSPDSRLILCLGEIDAIVPGPTPEPET